MNRRAITLLVALAAAVLSVAVPSAAARPPTLQTAGAQNGLVTATWSLPPNVAPHFFEIARYPDVGVFGYFRQKLEDGTESHVRFGVLGSNQTSLTPDDPKPPLEPGTYYVHIAGHDRVHTGCPRVEFSDIMRIEIGVNNAAPITSTPVAPGTGNCTLVRGSGGGPAGGGGGSTGGSGGGGGSGVIAGDKTPPKTQLRFSRRQKLNKLRVRARMSEPGTLTARAIVDVGGLLARIYTFRPVSRKVTGGVLANLRLKLSKKRKRAVKRALRRGKRLRARVTVTATDRAGNTVTRHAKIRLKR